ncbi:MAG: tetratricopeptide repeat protein [Pseudomonadota bacterium]
MESIRLFLGDWADAATTLALILACISTYLAVRNYFAKTKTGADLAQMREGKSKAERRVKFLLQDREAYHPSSFLEKLDELSLEVDPEEADRLSGRFISNQREALVSASTRLARAAMMNFQEDGELALDEASRLATRGLAFAPDDTGLSTLLDEIQSIRSGETPEEREALKLDEGFDYATLSKAGLKLRQRGHYKAAVRVYEAARKKALSETGKTTLTFANATNDLAAVCRESGDYDRALLLFSQVMEIDEAIGQTHSAHHADHLNSMAVLLNAMGRLEEAEPLLLQAIEIGKATVGEAHPDYATRLNNLAILYRDLDRLEEAEPLLLQAIDITKATVGAAHPDYARGLSNLASLYWAMGRLEEAEPLYLQAIDITKSTIGEAHPNYATRLNNLAHLYQAMGRLNEALPLIDQAVAIFEAALPEGHPHIQIARDVKAAIEGDLAGK